MKKYLKVLLVFAFALSFSACTVRVSQQDVYTLNQKAAEYMNQGDYDSAIARLLSIIDLESNHPEVYYNLGVAYIKKQDYEKAIQALNNAITLNQDFVEAYYSLGVAYESLADKQIAELGTTKDPMKKTEIRNKITQSIQGIHDSYSKYLEKAPESPEKQEVKAQFDYLGEKYKNYAIDNNATFRE